METQINQSKTVLFEKDTADSLGKIEIIEINRVSAILYKSFGNGYDSMDSETDIIKAVNDVHFDEKTDDAKEIFYYISLLKSNTSGEYIIWCSPGLSSEIDFHCFWIIFDENLETTARNTQEKLRVHFENTFFGEDENDFHEGIQTILDRIIK